MRIKEMITIGTGNIRNILSGKIACIKNIRRLCREVFANGQQVPAAGGKSLFPNDDSPLSAGSVCRRTTTPRRQREVFVTRTMTPRWRREVFVAEQRPPANSRRCLLPNNNSPPAAGRFLTVYNRLQTNKV
jgi:hypothetical protein